jgi:hypothetical protein
MSAVLGIVEESDALKYSMAIWLILFIAVILGYDSAAITALASVTAFLFGYLARKLSKG